MIDKIENCAVALQQAWDSCEFDNDRFVEQALSVLREMRELVGAVEIFEKE